MLTWWGRAGEPEPPDIAQASCSWRLARSRSNSPDTLEQDLEELMDDECVSAPGARHEAGQEPAIRTPAAIRSPAGAAVNANHNVSRPCFAVNVIAAL